jgi:hypothetical protein
MKTFLFIALAIMPLITFAQNEKGELKGVITYFFNDNFGDKPDIGAQVMIEKINPERTPEENKYDSALVNLKKRISFLEQAISTEKKDIAGIDTSEKKHVVLKGKSIQTINSNSVRIKKRSLQAMLDTEQIKHEENVSSIKDVFNKSNKSSSGYSEYYDKIQSEAERHYNKQIDIIDSFGKSAFESENKIKLRKLNSKNELDIAYKTNAEQRYKSMSDMLKYMEEMEVYRLVDKKIEEITKSRDIIANLQMAEMYRYYLRIAPSNKFKNEQITKLKAINAYPEEKFNELDKIVYDMVSNIRYGEDVKITTVDGNGNYSLKLDPGVYYLIIRSKGRKDHSLTESDGKISGIDIVQIKANEVVEKSENFRGGY